MVEIRGWKIWYEDLTTYSSKNGLFADAPDDGFIYMYVYLQDGDKRRRQTHSGVDTYFSDDNGLFGSNNDSLEDNQKRYPNCSFKRGKWVHVARYEAIRLMAGEDGEI